jgi:hypothetical protein
VIAHLSELHMFNSYSHQVHGYKMHKCCITRIYWSSWKFHFWTDWTYIYYYDIAWYFVITT